LFNHFFPPTPAQILQANTGPKSNYLTKVVKQEKKLKYLIYKKVEKKCQKLKFLKNIKKLL